MPLFTVARQVLRVYYPPNSIQGVSAASMHSTQPGLTLLPGQRKVFL